MKLYGHPISGHAHRCKAFLQILNLEFEEVIIDLASGAHKQPDYLKISPLGQVPAFEDGDVALRDSAAILTYLAMKYDPQRTWLPQDPARAAEVQQWLITSAKEVYEGPFKARLVKVLGAQLDLEAAQAATKKLMEELLEPHLEGKEWLVGDTPTIADIANYSYISVSHEGGVDLSPYKNVTAWLKRVESIEGLEPMIDAVAMMQAKG